jgi:two-component system chemotaxis sensor kinase CheA
MREAVMGDKGIKEVFLNETREILTNLESDLVLLEQGGDAELLNRIFRYVHTLKGSSAIAGYDRISEFMHGLENVLELLRTGGLAIDERLTDLLLDSSDWVKLELFGEGEAVEGEPARRRLVERIRQCADAEGGPEPEAASDEEHKAAGDGVRYVRVKARFRTNIFESGIDPLSIMEDFVSLGEMVAITVDDRGLPGLYKLDPERCYLAWEVTIRTAHTASEIDEVFMFVKEDNEIVIEDVSRLYGEESEEKYTEDKKIGEILVEKGVLTGEELEDVLADQGARNRKIGEIIVEKGYASEKEISRALSEQDRIRTRIETGTVRVDTKKLDSLLNLLGEIVIGQSAIAGIAEALPEEQGFTLKNALYGLDRITREFQEQIMSIRMIPIGPAFNQFRRFVRDTARGLGKDIRLEIFGEETELDKTVIEKISDPLKHMIRNAIDHGIETASERTARGKAPQGRIRLNAYHQEGNVFIEVTDDGKGLDRERIRERAVFMGLIRNGEETTDERLCSFLFVPGFTTSEEAGDLSGRGVGMDVVKTNIEALRGTVEIETEPDVGTTFRLKLPLTLAIIEGMLVRSGSSIYIIPLLSIVECIQPKKEEVEVLEGKGELLMVRGTYVPLVRLYELFGTGADFTNPWESLVVIGK